MAYHYVPDPLWAGKDPSRAPLMLRSEAMRRMHAAGHSVAEVARFYEVRYHLAYKTIKSSKR